MKSRRAFLKIVMAGTVSFFLFLWNKLTLNHIETSTPKQYIFPFNKNKIVTFNGDFIIVSQNNTAKVYSAHCTHLGCRIDKVERERFVCPCHGSEYDLNGKVLKGPAFRNLDEFPASISDDGNSIVIES